MRRNSAEESLTGYLRFFAPVLDVLRDLGGSARSSQVKDLVVDRLHISDEEREAVLNNGVSRVGNQIDWARFYLAKTGYLDSSKRGVWALTEKGRFARLTPENVREIVREVSATVKTAGSDDDGIDGHGVLRVSKLVSMKVLFQCKRYKDSVGPSVVRDFRGSLAGRAEKGIILTTGYFTTSAEQEARCDGVVPVELVDGERLVELFEEMEIGLKNPRSVYDVDEAFFARFRVET